MRPDAKHVAAWVRRALGALRQVAGMPDYEAFVEHHRGCHPDHPLPSRGEHYAHFVAERYGGGPTRCC